MTIIYNSRNFVTLITFKNLCSTAIEDRRLKQQALTISGSVSFAIRRIKSHIVTDGSLTVKSLGFRSNSDHVFTGGWAFAR